MSVLDMKDRFENYLRRQASYKKKPIRVLSGDTSKLRVDSDFCSLNSNYVHRSFREHQYVFLLTALSTDIGAFMTCSIKVDDKGKVYIYIDTLCTNQHPIDPDYTHENAATAVIEVVMKFVDYINKTHNKEFFLRLDSVPDATDYYFRKHFNFTNKRKGDLLEMDYGGKTKNKSGLSRKHKQLKLLRDGTSGRGKGNILKRGMVKAGRIKKIRTSISTVTGETNTVSKSPVRFGKRSSVRKVPVRRTVIRKSRRLNKKKRYDYDFVVYINSIPYY